MIIKGKNVLVEEAYNVGENPIIILESIPPNQMIPMKAPFEPPSAR